MITKLIKLGKSSLVMVLPMEVRKQLGWKKGQRVVVSAKGKSLKIRDYKKK